LESQRSGIFLSVINHALPNGVLSGPIPIGGDFPIVQYVDDTIIILPDDKVKLGVFKDVLDKYASFTSLKVNYHKSSMIPINVSKEEAKILA
jgi:hypothetical protein